MQIETDINLADHFAIALQGVLEEPARTMINLSGCHLIRLSRPIVDRRTGDPGNWLCSM